MVSTRRKFIKTAMGGKLAHAFVKGNVAIVKEEIEDN